MRFGRCLSQLISSTSFFIAVVGVGTAPPALMAQNSIQLFGPVNVRLSATGTGYGAQTANFNSTTLNLNCAASPIKAVLSSSPDGTGNLLVDNNINVTVSAGETTTGPINACVGGVVGSPTKAPIQNCFSKYYMDTASAGTLTGLSPDPYVAAGGVAPIDIGPSLVSGQVQVKIDLADEGGYLTNSTLFLNTNCTQGGVTGPALISGNPINSNNPTPDQLSQDFTFNPSTDQQIGFEYDLTAALKAGSLSITNGTIPQVGDSPIDPAIFQSVLAKGTSFATSSCLIHSGELLPSGAPACKLFTLECKVGTGSTALGALCPVSTLANELFRDTFDGPAFTLSDIVVPNGPTFHEGIGFLMASEGWTGGPCTFDPASGLQNLPCPQNLLVNFSGPGLYAGTGRTTHPNSTFVSVAQVPEPLTTVTLVGALPGTDHVSGQMKSKYWFKSDPIFKFSTQPPILAGSGLPGAADFVPSPIASLTFGNTYVNGATPLDQYGHPLDCQTYPYECPADNLPPMPGDAISGETTLTDSLGCPSPTSPGIPAATVFTPGQQTISGLGEGYYLLHYYAQDCAGTEEFQFTQDNTASWSTHFYTVPFAVDKTAPAVIYQFIGGNGTYQVGDNAYLDLYCTDNFSGVADCDGNGPGGQPQFGFYSHAFDTSFPGTKSLNLTATDYAGNQTVINIPYTVQFPPQNNKLQISLSASSITYPGSTIATVKVGPGQDGKRPPSGLIKLVLDGKTLLATQNLGSAGNGFAADYFYLPGIPAGSHTVSAVFSQVNNFNNNLMAASPAIPLHVLPAPVTLPTSCPKATIAFGTDFSCIVFTKPILAGASGNITFRYDGGPLSTVPLSGGAATITLTKPTLGPHSIVISYPAQGNYAAAGPQTIQFKVLAPTH